MCYVNRHHVIIALPIDKCQFRHQRGFEATVRNLFFVVKQVEIVEKIVFEKSIVSQFYKGFEPLCLSLIGTHEKFSWFFH